MMSLTSFLPSATPKSHHHGQHKRKKKPSQPPPPPQPAKTPAPPSSWEQFKSLLSCRIAAPSTQVHDPSKLGGRSSSCGSSICAFRDVVHGNTRVVHRSDTDRYSSASDSGPLDTTPLARRRHRPPPPPVVSSGSHSKGGMQLRKLSGCYECHAISAEPASRYPRSRLLCACPSCGEVFTKSESLELHQTIRHAVSELGPEDSGRNIVEIIFKSSWQKKDHPICKIERILKVHTNQRTIARFEDYRNAVKGRALLHLHAASAAAGGLRQPLTNKKNPRCAADGNELLRFHCTTLACSLGARGSTALCSSAAAAIGAAAPCGVCAIIRHGFGRAHHPHGVRTTASSGRAHDCGLPSSGAAGGGGGGGLRAMLVCRVIAGRILRPGDADPVVDDAYDSVAGGPGPGDGGAYATLEELFVANPRAILPCFVVIYRSLD
ncbi:uncharacterized protein LOC103719889 isoform X2 [Phoenix dactylifera]|uniref:Uncharacterized protein LOC103719889 isoform X2 n=1 Tax=Phoenix dactylifera TaxID=42345 RepID=A0A8B8ZJ48_PHODC|nr:uncharacterized protein LOC103719889 isoform X2 [Phoenix dactylifera]